MADRLDDHGQVELALLEQFEQRPRAGFAERQRRSRDAARKGRQRPRQQVRADARRRADGQRALAQARQLLDLESRFVQALQHRARVRQERLAGLGQRHVALHAVEQRRAELGLQLADLLADRRLGDVQLLGRAGEVQMAAHRLEVGELMDFHGSGRQTSVVSRGTDSRLL